MNLVNMEPTETKSPEPATSPATQPQPQPAAVEIPIADANRVAVLEHRVATMDAQATNLATRLSVLEANQEGPAKDARTALERLEEVKSSMTHTTKARPWLGI